MLKVYEKYLRAVLKVILTVAVFLLLYISVTCLFPFFAPFVIALVLAAINEPLIRLLERYTKLPRKIAAVISLLFTISILGVIITLGIIKIYQELSSLQANISKYIASISDQFDAYMKKVTLLYNSLPNSISSAVDENFKSLAPKLQSVLTSIVTYLINTITSIPKMAVFIIVTLLSTYFISSDRRQITNFITRQFPESWSKNFSGIKSNTFAAVLGYFKAILMLMALTFMEASLGLFIIGADYVLLMGLLVALSDAIPVLGTGVIMVPWILWNLAIGNMHMVLGLTIIYVFGVIIRQILEPKIVGDQIGLHPLATLVAMYVGLSVFGILGLFIGPISVIIVKNLQQSGLIRIWNE